MFSNLHQVATDINKFLTTIFSNLFIAYVERKQKRRHKIFNFPFESPRKLFILFNTKSNYLILKFSKNSKTIWGLWNFIAINKFSVFLRHLFRIFYFKVFPSFQILMTKNSKGKLSDVQWWMRKHLCVGIFIWLRLWLLNNTNSYLDLKTEFSFRNSTQKNNFKYWERLMTF